MSSEDQVRQIVREEIARSGTQSLETTPTRSSATAITDVYAQTQSLLRSASKRVHQTRPNWYVLK